MIGIIVATHGDFVFGLKDTYEMVAGVTDDNVNFISLAKNSDAETFKNEFKKIVEKFRDRDGILALVDLEGGTPFNVASEYFYNTDLGIKMEVIAGVNLPMLVEAISGLDSKNVKVFADEIKETGIESIKRVEKICDEEKFENDEF